MLAITSLGGSLRGGRGLGAYTCPGNVCTPTSGDTSTIFRRLQSVANEAGKMLGLGAPVAVDGKIGPATVAKIYMVSVAMPPRPDLVRLMSMDSQTTPGGVAANAAGYVDELEALISGEIQMPGDYVGPINPYPTLPVSTTLPGNLPTQPAPQQPGAGPHITTSASSGFKAPPLATKIALGAVAAGLVVVLITRRKRSAATISGARRRRRR